MAIRYSSLYDSKYDDEKLIWLEFKCSDPTCNYCCYRPDYPTLNQQDEIINHENTRFD
jgi:hypothetical protein